MPSERRLHPLSIGFWLAGQLRRALLPLIFGAASASFVGGFDLRTLILGGLVLSTGLSVVRFLTFRYRYEAGELVIRTGLLFRRERHVPYARIQNLDAVQGVFHRVLGVVEVKVQTGSGDEPEATMTVLPVEALSELRRRVFEGRSVPPVRAAEIVEPADGIAAEAGADDQLLLHLPPGELILYGLIQNRGMIVIAAVLGVGWETGILERLSAWAFGEGSWGGAALRDLVGGAFTGALSPSRIALAVAVAIGVLFFARLLSMAWALVRLYDYRIVRAGEDLRTTFGSLTQVSATIPLRRIQTATIHEGPLHRLVKRVAVRVETAGGVEAKDSDPHRQWLVPLIRRDRLPDFLAEIVPELDPGAVSWQEPASGAFGRLLRESGVVASGLSLPVYFAVGLWGLAAHGALLGWAALYADRHLRHLRWAVKDETVLFRSGWLWRRTTIARFAKIQVVSFRETPFDRRRRMARVRVDTAGAGTASHKVEIPYIAVGTARQLSARLAAEAAQTAFRW